MARKINDVADLIASKIPGLIQVKSHDLKVAVFLFAPVVHVIRGFSVHVGKKDTSFCAFARLLCEPYRGVDWVCFGLVSIYGTESILRNPPNDDMLMAAVQELVDFDKFIRPINSLADYLRFASDEDVQRLSLNKPNCIFADAAIGNYDEALYLLKGLGIRPAERRPGRTYDDIIHSRFDLRDCLELRPHEVPQLLNRWEEETVQVLGIGHLWSREKFN
jgi:hypothetical protein